MVSVIIPVYNSEGTIFACVQSILNQTFSDYELILIDDGSKDQSGEICDELEETCVSRGVRCHVIHKENGGVSSARNCGMDHANGEYFVFVDSDDTVEPCYLEDLVSTAESHPDLGFVVCGFRSTSPANDYILTKRESLSIVGRRDYMCLYEHILIQNIWLALYRSSIVRTFNILMREDLSLGEDLFFNLKYLDAIGDRKIGVINKTNYIYHNDNQESLYRKYRQDLLELHEFSLETIKIYLGKWGVIDQDAWRSYYAAVFFKYLSVLENTFRAPDHLSTKTMVKYNNYVMRRPLFREALKQSKIRLSRSYRLAYSLGDYWMVMFARKLESIKAKCRSIRIDRKN